MKKPSALTAYRDAHHRCAVCRRALTPENKTIQHICRGNGKSDDPRNLLVCCLEPCHMAADQSAKGQARFVNGRNYSALTRGMLLWCKLMEDGEIDLGFLTKLRPTLMEETITAPPAEYLAWPRPAWQRQH